MRADVARDLSDSAFDFLNVVWPAIGPLCGGGLIEPTEGVAVPRLVQSLDVLSGIDAFQIVENKGMRGIASRVQWGASYPTFTIRKSRSSGAKTEFEKRIEAMNDANGGWLLPHLTIQGYVSRRRDGQLLYACAALTTSIYRHIDMGREGQHRWTGDYWTEVNPQDRNEFFAVSVQRLRASGALVSVWPENLQQALF